MNKAILVITSLIEFAIILLIASITVFSYATKIPFLSRLGLNFYSVISGSMEPSIPTGALIYAGKYQLEQLKKDDVIVFQVKDPETSAVHTVTHRINQVLKTEKTEKLVSPDGTTSDKILVRYEFVTKGDANNKIDDRSVPSTNILGIYRWHLPYLGYLTAFAQTGRGFIFTVIIPAIILVIWEFISLGRQLKTHYQEKSQKELEKLKAELIQAHTKKTKKRS